MPTDIKTLNGNNRKNPLILAYLSFVAALIVAFITTISISFSPIIVIFPILPVAGIIGIKKRNKELIVIPALISFTISLLAIMSVGILLITSSLLMIASSFLFLKTEPEVEVHEKARKTANIAALSSLFASAAASVYALFWLYLGASSSSFQVVGLVFYSVPILFPLLGIIGIRNGNAGFLNTSSAFSLITGIFLGLLLQKTLFLASPLLLVISAFVYQEGIALETREFVDKGFWKIALILAAVSLLSGAGAAIYSEMALVTDGCYSYQTSPTSGGTVCSDFRPDYVIPVIFSAIGIAGILRQNRMLLYASASLYLAMMVRYISYMGVFFFPSFILLLFSAVAYQKGVRKTGNILEKPVDSKNAGILLFLLLLFVVLWIIAVYYFVEPASSGMSGGYGTVRSHRVN